MWGGYLGSYTSKCHYPCRPTANQFERHSHCSTSSPHPTPKNTLNIYMSKILSFFQISFIPLGESLAHIARGILYMLKTLIRKRLCRLFETSTVELPISLEDLKIFSYINHEHKQRLSEHSFELERDLNSDTVRLRENEFQFNVITHKDVQFHGNTV